MLLPLLASFFVSAITIIQEPQKLEGTHKDHPVQPPCSEQGHLQQDQSAQSSVQFDLECLQRQSIHLWATSLKIKTRIKHGKVILKKKENIMIALI